MLAPIGTPPIYITHPDLLQKLADGLRKIPESKFNYEELISDGDSNTLEDMECGTRACAIGWCPYIFPDTWRFYGNWPGLRTGYPTGKYAAEKFFGLDCEQANYLFLPTIEEEKWTPLQVADRIEWFIEEMIRTAILESDVQTGDSDGVTGISETSDTSDSGIKTVCATSADSGDSE